MNASRTLGAAGVGEDLFARARLLRTAAEPMTSNGFAPALQGAACQASNAARCLTFAALILDDAGLEFWDGAVELVERVHDLASHLAGIYAETAAREVCRGEGGGR